MPRTATDEMPHYRFTSPNGDRLKDEEGVILPDDQSARAYGMRIMNEMQQGEAAGKVYEIDVIRDDRVVWHIIRAGAVGTPHTRLN